LLRYARNDDQNNNLNETSAFWEAISPRRLRFLNALLHGAAGSCKSRKGFCKAGKRSRKITAVFRKVRASFCKAPKGFRKTPLAPAKTAQASAKPANGHAKAAQGGTKQRWLLQSLQTLTQDYD